MADELVSLTYLSLASRPLEHEELVELLEVSRARNAEAGVTGLLLYADQQFIQVLEGRREDVEATMERIRTDRRHRGIDVTLVEEIEERQFPEWWMGFRALDAATVADLRSWTDYLEPGSELYERSRQLGRAGVFLRVFRDTMRPDH